MHNRLPHGHENVCRWLNQHRACSEGMAWVRENKFESLADLWSQCKRSDWMLWLLARIEYKNDRDLRLFACACVRAIWDHLTDDRSRRATEEELNFAKDAAWDACADMLRDKIKNPFAECR